MDLDNKSIEKKLLSGSYLTQHVSDLFSKHKEDRLHTIKSEIVLAECQKIENDINGSLLDEAIQLKEKRVQDYLERLHIQSVPEMVKHVEQQKSVNIPNKRRILSEKNSFYIKTILQVLDVTWSIIEEFKYKLEKDKNMEVDEYYTSLVDAFLIKAKTLHVTILISLYDDAEFIKALQTLKNTFEKKYLEAETNLVYTTKQLREYHEMGPEFETLCRAHHSLLEKIQITKDDIQKIKND